LASEDLSNGVRRDLRTMLWSAFDDFSEDDWEHGLGGVHIVAFEEARPIGHASVISRTLHVGDTVLAGGYLEAVAVDAEFRGHGIGADVVRAARKVIEDRFPMAALSTSQHGFYEKLGWERWLGPSYVVSGTAWRRTEDEDAGVMVLRPRESPVQELTQPIAVDERSGDAW
jgi:aminoglycoside 2'-N-acetyltransferase I